MDINVYLLNAISKIGDKEFEKAVISTIENYLLMDKNEKELCPFKGTLTSDTLNVLLSKENGRFGLELANWALPNFASAGTVDRHAFERIVKLKGRYGRSLRLSLAHESLAFYQLVELTKTNEAGMELDIILPILFENDFFTIEDVEEILSKTKAPNAALRSALDWSKHYSGTAKYDFAERFYSLSMSKNSYII